MHSNSDILAFFLSRAVCAATRFFNFLKEIQNILINRAETQFKKQKLQINFDKN